MLPQNRSTSPIVAREIQNRPRPAGTSDYPVHFRLTYPRNGASQPHRWEVTYRRFPDAHNDGGRVVGDDPIIGVIRVIGVKSSLG
jgi:hypothetical protein